MDIFVLRHARTRDNELGLVSGQSNPSILPQYLPELDGILRALKGISFDLCVASDLDRTKQTLDHIRTHLGISCPIEIESRLREVDYGDLEGMKKHEVRAKFPRYKTDPAYVHPNGESYEDAYERVQQVLASLMSKKEQSILLVAHSGVLRILEAICDNKALKDSMDLPLQHNVLVHCKYENGEWFATTDYTSQLEH